MSEKTSHPIEPKMYTATELVQEHRQDMAAHWTPAEKRTHMEKEYRRGYRDGYVEALSQFYELTVERGLSREAAYERLWEFWQEELGLWQSNRVRMPNGDVQVYDKWGFELPPSPNMKRK